MENNEAAILADFQEFYHLDIFDFIINGDDTNIDYVKIGILIYGLLNKKESRLANAINPDEIWIDNNILLSSIELNLRRLSWQISAMFASKGDRNKVAKSEPKIYIAPESVNDLLTQTTGNAMREEKAKENEQILFGDTFESAKIN